MSTTSILTKGSVSCPTANTRVVAGTWLRLLGEDPVDNVQTRILSLQERYVREREKRIRQEGRAQYIDVTYSEKHKYLADDIWTTAKQSPQRLCLQDSTHTKILVVGGGYGGLSFAVRSIQAGFDAKDIVIVESAGGYGGTWYWNRYPGLMCDVESYIYMPLLEETGYIPKHKYSHGPELREHAERISHHWKLDEQGAFQQKVRRLEWDEQRKLWQVEIVDLLTQESVCVTAEFVHVCPGILVRPKIVNLPGVGSFEGSSFHTSRWDYDYTGGSPEDPSLVKLKDKRVGIIGTGASATGTIPYLAKWAKELYVFQRTPALVNRRGQKTTDLEQYRNSIQTHPGWQVSRNQNFNTFTTATNAASEVDLVSDGWSKLPQLAAFNGTTKAITPENVREHVATLQTLDAAYTEQARKRVDRKVHDKKVAKKLKAWYPTWCKRPAFQDDYLDTFNKPNVTLVDTDGKGIEGIDVDGIIANGGQHYDLDCIIFGTGFSLEKEVCPTRRAGITTIGRHGKSLDDKWSAGVATLHGVLTHDFPNLFFAGPTQASTSVNFFSATDELARHTAYIMSTALQRKNGLGGQVVVEPSLEAEEEWAQRIVATGIAFAPLAGCTPSYFNAEGEGERMSDDDKKKAARMGMWGRGANDFMRVVKEWRDQDAMEGLLVSTA